MIWLTFAVASVLATKAHASAVGPLTPRDRWAGWATDEIERRVAALDSDGAAKLAGIGRDTPRVIVMRQKALGDMGSATSPLPGVVLNPDGTINMTAWEETATTACTSALARLPESSNPSGTCVCYNLPALNNMTGTFEADLRLYQLSTPKGAFTGIPPEKIQVQLSYAGANVSPVSSNTANKLVAGRQAGPVGASGGSTNGTTQLRLLQTYFFLGQIKQSLLPANMDTAKLEALVTPVITLTGATGTGQTVSTNVSSNEAAFVAGVFSDMVVMSETARANVAVDKVVSDLHNKKVAFVLPGVQLILFPIGLIITSVWLTTGLAVYGFGTMQRVGFREQFKRRAMQASKSKTGRI